MPQYTKPYRTVESQIALLQSRGMEITDEGAAAACLGRIGYYRLSGYWYSARNSHSITDQATGKPQLAVEDTFRAGTTFQQAIDVYVFDKRLRMLFLDAIERVEIALRVDIALLIGSRSPWAHRDATQLHGNFTKKINPLHGETEFKKWLERLDQTFDRSKDEFVKHFKRKYPDQPPPVWIAIEVWDFGMLSIFLSGMQISDREMLAKKYGLPRHPLLTSWARNLNNVRNMCAHHGRLWNRSPADQPAPPKRGEVEMLNHLATDKFAQSRIYATAAVLQFLLRKINPSSSWGRRLQEHVDTFPTSAVNIIGQAGFPEGWKDFALWR